LQSFPSSPFLSFRRDVQEYTLESARGLQLSPSDLTENDELLTHSHACEGKQNEVENAKRKPGEPKKFSVEPFPLYTLRHTCLTRWAPHMDPWALAYLAGHRDMSITKRYVHPQEKTIREAMERARGGHNSGHNAKDPKNAADGVEQQVA